MPASDPERLRWDAVKLVLDLLTKDDRILVLPFNETCPATALSGTFSYTVPGGLDRQLNRVENVRTQLDQKLQQFTHSGNDETTNRTAVLNEWNGDGGGTRS